MNKGKYIMSNFKANFDNDTFLNFGTVDDIMKSKASDGVFIESIDLHPIECGVLTPITFNFLSLFETLTLDIIDRLEHGEFDALLNEMESV